MNECRRPDARCSLFIVYIVVSQSNKEAVLGVRFKMIPRVSILLYTQATSLCDPNMNKGAPEKLNFKFFSGSSGIENAGRTTTSTCYWNLA